MMELPHTRKGVTKLRFFILFQTEKVALVDRYQFLYGGIPQGKWDQIQQRDDLRNSIQNNTKTTVSFLELFTQISERTIIF